MPRVCVFDVNETLLDLRALDPLFQRAFGDAAVRQQWFAQFIANALVATITDRYRPFGAIGAAALDMIAARRGATLAAESRSAILAGLKTLPAHPDVRPALERLRRAGLRLAALTNSTADVAVAQLTNAGLSDLFERILSADAVRRLKPAPEPYRHAARELGVEIGQVRLVAAHAWDIAGALSAGCAAAFVARPGMVLDPAAEQPDVVGDDMQRVVERIMAAEGVAPG
jgi:2-haloacid dehalogenase